MFVRNQPLTIRSLAANGRTQPEFEPVLQASVSFVQVKHMYKRDISADRNIQVVSFQGDFALIFTKPSHEVASDCIGSGEVERGYTIEIDDVGGVERHESINVLQSKGLSAQMLRNALGVAVGREIQSQAIVRGRPSCPPTSRLTPQSSPTTRARRVGRRPVRAHTGIRTRSPRKRRRRSGTSCRCRCRGRSRSRPPCASAPTGT